jgi:hypothetical protein
VSDSGVGVGLRIIRDWLHFEQAGMILPPPDGLHWGNHRCLI